MHEFLAEDTVVILGRAAEYDNLFIVKFLLELPEDQRPDIHVGDDWPLWLAAINCRQVIVAYLLQHGADRTKLTARQIERLHNSPPAQKYIAEQCLIALSNKDLSAIEQLLEIIPLHKLPESTQHRLENVLVEFVLHRSVTETC